MEDGIDIVGLLPPELGQMVLSYLSAKELARYSGVSKKWRELANCMPLWKRHCIKREWPTLDMVEDYKSHFPSVLVKINTCESLGKKCSWRTNYERHHLLPINWEKNRSIRYRLSDPRDPPVACIACDGQILSMGRHDGSVTVINVERLPYYVKDFQGLLDSRILQIKIEGDFCVIQQSMLLQFFSIKKGFIDAKSFELGYGLIELMERTKWKPCQVKKRYKTGKLSDMFFEIIDEHLYVVVRDFQYIYIWNKFGKRINTIHISNRMCKMRDMLIYKDFIYIIYAASRSIRHVSAYDIKKSCWVFEVTTPLCKTQKLLGADSLLIGVAVAGPGMTCVGVITVWDRMNGKMLAEKHSQEYISFKSVATSYEVVIYSETTSVIVWAPRLDYVLRKVSTYGNPLYLKTLPFSLIAIFTDRCAYVWDWYMGVKNCRLYSKYASEPGEFLWADESMILIKTEEDLIEMIGFC